MQTRLEQVVHTSRRPCPPDKRAETPDRHPGSACQSGIPDRHPTSEDPLPRGFGSPFDRCASVGSPRSTEPLRGIKKREAHSTRLERDPVGSDSSGLEQRAEGRSRKVQKPARVQPRSRHEAWVGYPRVRADIAGLSDRTERPVRPRRWGRRPESSAVLRNPPARPTGSEVQPRRDGRPRPGR